MKDQPAGLIAPTKSLKTIISVDLAVALATGGQLAAPVVHLIRQYFIWEVIGQKTIGHCNRLKIQ